ncbi:MAG: serine/threonine-protein kinase [Pirellula sp.]
MREILDRSSVIGTQNIMVQKSHASDHQLRTLLFADEGTDDSREISTHVESCEVCQQRLTHLADAETIEQEITHLLIGYSMDPTEGANRYRIVEGNVDSRDEYLHKTVKTGQDEYSDQIEIPLGPPSHPEMLGRLGRYEIERKIGSGGMGVVFKAIDTELHRPVAIKVLAPHLARNGAARQRFGRESRAAAAVVHEHVVAIHNVESNSEFPYLVMQYISGESLQARVQRLGPLSVEQILRIGIQAASGLAAAHEQGIVHRDIKPANILLEDGVERVLITDFGLARTVDDASLTHTGIVAGTPHYMSPEQANGDSVDHRSDLFSLGSVLYFVATGHPPFRAEKAMGVLHRICHEPHRPAWQINAAIPDTLSEVIDVLLEKRPSRRLSSSAKVRDALTQILQQFQSRRPSLSSDIRSWARRHPQWSWLFASAGLCIAALVGVCQSGWFLNEPPSSTNLSQAVSLPSIAQPAVLSGAEQAPSSSNSTPQSQRGISFADASLAESSEFERSLQTLQRDLDQLSADDVQPHGMSVDTTWKNEIIELHQRLNAIDPSR